LCVCFTLQKDATAAATAVKSNHDDSATSTRVDYEWAASAIDLDDIFISVKTTKKYHETRLKTILETWFQLAKDQVINQINVFLCCPLRQAAIDLSFFAFSPSISL